MQSFLEDSPLSHRPPKTSRKGKKRAFDSIDGDSKHDGNPLFGSPSNELVLYDSGINDPGQDIFAATDHMENHTPTFRNFLAPNPSSRTFTTIGTFTVQCASCFKWRIIPTKEKYEQIRERILDEPFTCEQAREWRPDILCEDPEDISQDGSRLWAIDKPNIAQPPSGWERLLRIRGEGGTKFADVYYVAPSGKRLRSMVEVQKYLLEHPEYARQGVTLSQFSFQSPRPLQENYVRKRPRLTNSADGGDLAHQKPLEPEAANPLPRPAPTLKELLVDGSASSSPSLKEPLSSPPNESAAPTAVPSAEQVSTGCVHDEPERQVEDDQPKIASSSTQSKQETKARNRKEEDLQIPHTSNDHHLFENLNAFSSRYYCLLKAKQAVEKMSAWPSLDSITIQSIISSSSSIHPATSPVHHMEGTLKEEEGGGGLLPPPDAAVVESTLTPYMIYPLHTVVVGWPQRQRAVQRQNSHGICLNAWCFSCPNNMY